MQTNFAPETRNDLGGNLVSYKLVFDCYSANRNNFTYNFGDALTSYQQKFYRVVQVQMPFTMYNVTDRNDNNQFFLSFVTAGLTYFVTLEDGYYTLNNLFDALHQGFLDLGQNVTFSLIPYTNKVKITVVGDTVSINQNTLLMQNMGFTSLQTTPSAILISDTIPAITLTNVLIYSNIVSKGNLNVKNQQMMANIPIYGNFGDLIQWQNDAQRYQPAAGSERLQGIYFQFKDIYENDIVFNQLYPVIELEILEEI